MSRVLAVNENNDIYLGANGRLAILDGLPAVVQACKHAAEAQRGQFIYDTQRGIPNFTTIWNGSPNLPQYEVALRAALAAVDGVRRVSSLSVKISGGVLSYTATIETIYGEGAIGG